MMNYQAFSCLATGYSHRDGCCQDYAGHYEQENLRIAVVSDGHGDKSCFRSDVGSRFAVEIAIAQLKSFAGSLRELGWQDRLGDRSAREKLMRQLKRSIVAAWDTRVREHLRENPLTWEELSRPSRYSEAYRRGERLTHIYGCTLIAAMVVDGFLVVLHVGDGRCVVFHGDGTVDQPVPWDELCVGNVTTSLCHDDAADRCRHYVLSLEEDPVLACFVTTDGIEDSFSDLPGQNGLCAYFSDVLARTIGAGIPALEAEMREELPYISQYGSQDDTSFGAIVDLCAAEGMQEQFALAFEAYKCRRDAEAAMQKLNSMQRKMDVLRSNVITAEQQFQLSGSECRMAEQELEEARAELEKRRQTGPGRLVEMIRRLKEDLTQVYQEKMEKLKRELSDWIASAERRWDRCNDRKQQSLQNQEDARNRLEQARKALDEYSRLRQTYVDQHDAAVEKLEAIRRKEEDLRRRPAPEEILPDPEPEEFLLPEESPQPEESLQPEEIPEETPEEVSKTKLTQEEFPEPETAPEETLENPAVLLEQTGDDAPEETEE